MLTSIMLALQEPVWPQPNQHMVEHLMEDHILVGTHTKGRNPMQDESERIGSSQAFLDSISFKN